MTDQNLIIAQTKKWLSTLVIGHGLCPFAKAPSEAGNICYSVVESGNVTAQLSALRTELTRLDNDPSLETTLLICPNGLKDFEDYLDVLDMAVTMLAREGYEGVYQLASFHPDYRFEGEAVDAPSHYTNRAPYPVFHILREASVSAALAGHPKPQDIPARNIRLTQTLGLSAVKALLAACYEA